VSNLRPSAAVLISQVGRAGITPTPAEIAVFPGSSFWSFQRPSGGSIQASEFAVRVPHEDLGSYMHVTTPANVTGNSSFIRNPLTDGRTDARIFVTQTTYGTTPQPHVGLWYSASGGSWLIFNQNLAAMASDVIFHVYVAKPEDVAFAHVALPATLDGEFSYVDHPELNDHPHVHPIVTQNWNLTAVYNDHPVGMWYDEVLGRWAVWNTDGAAIPSSAGFNVLVQPPTCGDVDRAGRRSARDARDVRRLLAAIATTASTAHCSVSGGPDDCDVVDWALLRREQLRIATPPLAQVCRAAVGEA
jgi:hypothetical protein